MILTGLYWLHVRSCNLSSLPVLLYLNLKQEPQRVIETGRYLTSVSSSGFLNSYECVAEVMEILLLFRKSVLNQSGTRKAVPITLIIVV